MKNMKKLLSVALAVVMLFSTLMFSAVAAPAGYIKVVADGTELSFATDPVLVNGTVCMPFSALCELFKAEVVNDEESGSITVTYDGVKTILQIDGTTAKVGTAMVELDVAPYMVGEEIFAPMDLVAQALSCEAKYDETEMVVTLTPIASSRAIKFTESAWFGTDSAGAKTGKVKLNPTSQEKLYRNWPSSGYFTKLDISSITDFSSVTLNFYCTKFNTSVNLAIYDITEEEYLTLTEGATASGIDVETEKFPAGTQVAAKTYSSTSSVNGGFLCAPIDITDYVKSKVAMGEKTIYFRMTNVSGGNSTQDSARITNWQDKGYIEVAAPAKKLDFSGMKEYTTNVYSNKTETLRTLLTTSGTLYSSVLNRNNTGKELNTFATCEGFKTSNMYYTATLENIEGKVSTASLTFKGRATVDGTLNVYLLKDNKLSANKIPAAEEEAISTMKIAASEEYNTINIDIRKVLEENDGKIAIKLEFVPDEAVRQLPCFYVFSANSDFAPAVTVVTKA